MIVLWHYPPVGPNHLYLRSNQLRHHGYSLILAVNVPYPTPSGDVQRL